MKRSFKTRSKVTFKTIHSQEKVKYDFIEYETVFRWEWSFTGSLTLVKTYFVLLNFRFIVVFTIEKQG